MIKIAILIIFACGLYAEDLCSKKEGCFVKSPLESALSSPKHSTFKDLQKNEKANSKQTNLKQEEISTQQPSPENSNTSEEKKNVFENPQYFVLWIVILAGLYFYLREKKKKGKK